ncbi:MAG: sensor histidine kinase [Microbacterium sp.]|nr:sensor histidine kinase [Microbacterium sp.]
MTQAWLQLADNAAKYAPEGTPIEIGSRVLPDARIELWVRDRGPGIAPEAQARVFERFGRVEPGRGVRGSGLGLAIVSAIAAAHGGEVQLASAVGVGSRFAIVLPAGEPDGVAA